MNIEEDGIAERPAAARHVLMPASYLGLDLGTSGLKAVLWSQDGDLLGEAEAGYAVDRPGAGRAETPVTRWDAALSEVLGDLAGPLGQTEVAAIGIDGQMHGVVLTDEIGKALSPALLWSDQRATAQLGRFQALSVDERADLANPLTPGMTGPLLSWLVEHEPALVDRAHAALLPKDAFRSLLVPSVVTDRSDAAATLLWDVNSDDWSPPAAAALGIPERLLPPVRGSAEVVGTTDRLATEVGATAAVPVVVGAGDTPAARLALGPGAGTQVNLGSGGQIIAPIASPVPVADPVVHTYADATEGWYRMVALQSAGLALEWARTMLGLSWTDLYAAAGTTHVGAGGVSFLPFLHGERGAVAGPDARAGWVGAGAHTTRDDLARAAVEGVMFAVARACEVVEEGSTAGDAIALTGGGGRPPLVAQLLADTLDRPVSRHELRSASATGAAILAAAGVGVTLPRASAVTMTRHPGQQASRARTAYETWLDRVARL